MPLNIQMIIELLLKTIKNLTGKTGNSWRNSCVNITERCMNRLKYLSLRILKFLGKTLSDLTFSAK